MTTLDRKIKRLPHFYNKEPDSNLYRLLFLPSEQIDYIYQAHERAKIWRLVIDRAKGEVLDHIGLNLQQYRGKDNDSDYRLWLIVKRIANISKGEIESFNKALDLLLKDAFIGIYETWGEAVRLNQTEPDGLTLGGGEEWYLTGGAYFREPQEPAALVIEFCHQTMFDLIGEYYKDVYDDQFFLDGSHYLYEGRQLDGGTFFHPGESLDDMLVTTKRIREMLDLIKAGGVGLYWKGYLPSTERVSSDDEHYARIKDEPGEITKIAFGNEGHDSEGEPIAPDGTEEEVYGEVVVNDIQDSHEVGDKKIIHGALDWEQMVDYNVSSIGLYDEHGDLVAIRNCNPAFKDKKTRFLVTWEEEL